MFTAVAINETLIVTSLELHIGITNQVDVSVYAKSGDYKGFENSPTAWRQVAKTSVQAAGSQSGTIITSDQFKQIVLRPGRTHAFYVTISSPNLIYSTSSVAAGTQVATNQFLSINAGAGLTDKSFSSKLFEPRIFNGALIFNHTIDCFSQSVITYSFNIQYAPSLTAAQIYNFVKGRVRHAVQTLLNTTSDLLKLSSNNDITIASSQSLASNRTGGNGLCPNLQSGWSCVPIDGSVTLSHLIRLEEAPLQVAMLAYASNVTSALNIDTTKAKATYAGKVVSSAPVLISLSGNINAKMDNSQQEYLQAVTLNYLQKTTAGANILGVKILDQQLNTGSGSHGRYLQSSSLDVTTSITGEYTPPPDTDVGQESSDAINANHGKSYQQDIQNQTRQKPEWLRNKAYFDKVTGASSKALSGSPTSAPTSPSSGEGLSSGVLIGIIVIVAVLFLSGVYYFCFCRKRNQDLDNEKNDGMYTTAHTSILKYDDKILDAECFYDDPKYSKKGLNAGYGHNIENVYPSKFGA